MEDKTPPSDKETNYNRDATTQSLVTAIPKFPKGKSKETVRIDVTQKGSADVVGNKARKDIKKKKKEPAKPKIIMQSIAVADENSDSWSEEDYDSTELEVEIDERDEELDNSVILKRIRRLGNQKQIWKNSSEFYAMALGYLISPDAILSAIYGFRTFGVATVYPMAVCACFIAAPVMLLELALGQYTSMSGYSVFSYMAPVLGGIPYLMMIMNLVMVLNDFVLFTMTANVVRDLLDSSSLQASQCFNKWNDLTCHNVVNPCASLLKSTGIEYIPMQGRCVQKRWYTDLLSNDLDTATTIRQQTPEIQFLVTYLTSVSDQGKDITFFPSVHLLFYMSITFIVLLAAYKLPASAVVWVSKMKMLMIFVFLTTILYIRAKEPSPDFVAFPLKKDPVNWMDRDLISWAVLHALLVSKIGQGGLIAIGSQNNFRSNIFMNTLVIGVLSFLLPYLIAYLIHPFMDNMLWRIVLEFNMADQKKEEFFDAHRFGFNTIWQDTLIAFFVDKQDGQLMGSLFLTTLVLIFFAHKLIRLKTLIQPAVEQFGLEHSADLDVIRRAGLFWIMLIFWTKYLIPSKTASFYATVSGTAIVVVHEVLAVFLFYGPRRLLCNLNLMMFGMVHGSGDAVKSRLRTVYSLLLLVVFSIFMVVVPIYLLVIVVVSTQRYIERGGSKFRSAGFPLFFFTFAPLFGIIKILRARLRKQLVVNLCKPIPNLWGPKEENNRKRAEYEERQLRI